MTVNNAADCTFAGVIRDSAQGSGTGKVNLVKSGGGDLLLSGTNLYTGSTTVSGGMLQVTGSIQSTSAVSVASAATLYFNRAAVTRACGCPITGAGTVQIYQGAHGLYAGTGGRHLAVRLQWTGEPAQRRRSICTAPTPWAAARLNVAGGGYYDLATSAATTFSNAITLNGIGGTVDGYAKPAIYGDGSGGTYTLSGQITLAASSDVGNYQGNGLLTLSRQDHRPGRLDPRQDLADAER